MKRLAAVTFALVCSLPATVNAQEASASVLATVAQDLRLASEGDTDFGSVGNFAHIETINPSTPSATQTTAQFTASASAHISFSCPTEVTLSGPGGATMNFKPLLAISGFAEGPVSQPAVRRFEIKATKEGDFAERLDFVLLPRAESQ